MRFRLALLPALALAALLPGFALGDDEKPKDEKPKSERERLLEEMAKANKKFLESVKIAARDAAAKAEQTLKNDQAAPIAIGIRPDRHVKVEPTKDDLKPKNPNEIKAKDPAKDGGTKDSKGSLPPEVDSFEVFCYAEEPKKDPPPDDNANPKAPKPPVKPPALIIWSVHVDADMKTTTKRLAPEDSGDATNCARRMAAAGAKVSVRTAIEKVQAFAKGAQILSVLLEDRENKALPPKGELPREDWLVHALVGEQAAFFLVDVSSGEVRKKG